MEPNSGFSRYEAPNERQTEPQQRTNEREAPTGIEPVTSSSRAVEQNLLDWAELQAARAVSVYRPLFEPGGGV